jgi:phospholipid/cholesterol/gamma-HCH transport system permease protein
VAQNVVIGTESRGDTAVIRAFFQWFGDLGLFFGRVVRSGFSRRFDLRELIRQCDNVGAQSAFLVLVAGGAIGVVLALETRNTLIRFGAESSLPALIIVSIIRETGPTITGLIASGRVGAGISAELGAMKVTDQIDAMEVSSVDPYRYLAATRVLACILMLPLLTLVCDASGILMGWVVKTLMYPTSLRLFLDTGLKRVTFHDLVPPTLKTMIFGLIIGVVSCFLGMRVTGGTAGVGRAVTKTVVLSSLFIILADVVLVRLILVFFP